MARTYAALPYEYRREMGCLSDAEFGRLCRALLEYSELGTPIALVGNERFYAERVMMMEDKHRQSYEDAVQQKRDAGRESARKRADRKAAFEDVNGVQRRSTAFNGVQRTPTEANETNDNKNKNENKNENEALPPIGGEQKRARAREGKPRRFSPPSVEDVAAYCLERGNDIDPESFCDFYAAKGWKVGSQPMKDWRACIRTWEKRERQEKQKERTGSWDFYDL